MRRSGPTRHVFVEEADGADPITGVQWCARCGLPSHNSIHDLPERTDEQRTYEDRKTGER